MNWKEVSGAMGGIKSHFKDLETFFGNLFVTESGGVGGMKIRGNS